MVKLLVIKEIDSLHSLMIFAKSPLTGGLGLKGLDILVIY